MKSQNGGGVLDFLYPSNGKSTDDPFNEAIEKLNVVKSAIDTAKGKCKGDPEKGTIDLITETNEHLTKAIAAIENADRNCTPNQDAEAEEARLVAEAKAKAKAEAEAEAKAKAKAEAEAKAKVVENTDNENARIIGPENAGGSNRKSRKGKKSRKFALKHAKRGRKTVKKGRKSEWNTFVTSVYKKNKLTNPMYMFKNALKDAAKIYKK
jgi:membrane protein involved in colicin uptake